jgi:hypothetical protein
MSSPSTAQRSGWRRAALLAAVLVGAVAVGLANLATSPRTSGADVGDLDAAVTGAITALNTGSALPAGVRPGLFSAADREAVRSGIRSNLIGHFTGTALTNILTNQLRWADRIATSSAESHSVYFELLKVLLDEPVMYGESATISGRYVMVEQSAWDLPDGETATIGGTYTNVFTYQLERVGGAWLVTSYTDQPFDFVPDPKLSSNLDLDPNPDATKPPPLE